MLLNQGKNLYRRSGLPHPVHEGSMSYFEPSCARLELTNRFRKLHATHKGHPPEFSIKDGGAKRCEEPRNPRNVRASMRNTTENDSLDTTSDFHVCGLLIATNSRVQNKPLHDEASHRMRNENNPTMIALSDPLVDQIADDFRPSLQWHAGVATHFDQTCLITNRPNPKIRKFGRDYIGPICSILMPPR